MKKGRLKKDKETINIIVTGLAFVFGTFLLALCYNLFYVPNNLVVGGMSGLGIIIEKLTGFNARAFIYVSNIILLGIAYLFLGKDETKRMLVGSLLYPLFVTFTAPIATFLLNYLSFQEILVTVVLASMLHGFSNGIIYKYGYSTGGSDIVVRLMCRFFHLSEGKNIIIFNSFIILAGGFMFGADTAVYAMIIIIISSIIVDKICIGISDSKQYMIYTRKPNDVKKLIQSEFEAGYTEFPTVGGYSHKDGVMIMCVIRNRDTNLFNEKILTIDSSAFFVVSDCYKVQGGVKRSNLPFM